MEVGYNINIITAILTGVIRHDISGFLLVS